MLIVSPLPPPAGGVANWTRILSERGLPAGWQASIVDTRTRSAVFGSNASRLRVQEAVRYGRIFASLARSLASFRPHIAHINVTSFGPGLQRDMVIARLCRAAGVPYVLHYRGDFARLGAFHPLNPHRRLFARVARRAALNLSLHDGTSDVLRAVLGPDARIVKVPNYFDDREIGSQEPIARLGRAKAVFVGGLTRNKGAHLLVEAARGLPEVDFVLAGKPYPDTQAALDGAPDNVILRGELDHAGVIAELRGAHVFTFPTDHVEGFPNAVCEAMAAALPVVAYPRGDIGCMIDDGPGGVILPDHSVSALVQAIRTVLDDEPARQAMGRYNRDKAFREYRYDVVVKRLTDLYASVLDASTGVG